MTSKVTISRTTYSVKLHCYLITIHVLTEVKNILPVIRFMWATCIIQTVTRKSNVITYYDMHEGVT